MYGQITRLIFLLGMAGLALPCLSQKSADVLEHARPAIVTVFTTDSKGKETGLGSGFIVRADGVIVTAWHVVSGAAKARIKLADGHTYAVIGLVGKDKVKDFALFFSFR
jgi:S1-C subfamily serine protease